MTLGLTLSSISVITHSYVESPVHDVVYVPRPMPPSPTHPHPAFATSGLRHKSPLDFNAELLTTKRHLYQLDLNNDGTSEAYYYGPDDGDWIYVTTSSHTERDEIIDAFDDAFREVLAREDVDPLWKNSFLHFIDCATNIALCNQGIPFASAPFKNKMKPLTPPSLIHVKTGDLPCTVSNDKCGYDVRCTSNYHYFDLPLRYLPWSKTVKIPLKDGTGKHVVVPAFPNPAEQIRNVMRDHGVFRALETIEDFEESEGIWRISVVPTG